jgi:predicted O-linked N-acetylglucosamine transferase (SPINDLY family)
VGYLGYPGTTGSGHIDYLIADRTVVPEACQPHYSEKMVYLPHCFQVNDRKRRIASKVCSREELGLPATGIVFCCLNNSYKITPDVFDGWIHILKRVDGSVLWLLKDNPMAADNLRREAARRQIDPDRLVFATRAPYADYLARLRAADLFLDSLPFNAGTTASDALWAGLPVLTRRGEAFASRMAASLLTAIDLPELITDTKEDYESLAVELAANPERLNGIRQKLARNRLTAPLFDTPRFTRHLEEAYRQMYERYQADLPPDHIYVRP